MALRAILRASRMPKKTPLISSEDKRTIYHPFGETRDWVSDAAAAEETKGFIGERYDADAGLQYLNARYYDPELGLFIQPDR